eukprot:CAMPEP_0206572968 /NCGR_PEP_ID=MMETSP0325_2-20121206/28569_1 /ASSEMBLY_ACC=CAM_ASM_000347 /TAXON_ID=2866 /ORGANISM="Crypthecodinium cohnii, Strain Seligo" /LENGTH=82 /DNA_ID=CAMNT_0054077289 /DNA_START=66 /DNA_END=312 /DNA_ORIENTATION=+
MTSGPARRARARAPMGLYSARHDVASAGREGNATAVEPVHEIVTKQSFQRQASRESNNHNNKHKNDENTRKRRGPATGPNTD